MCLYKVFSVHCTGYTLVYIKVEDLVIFLPHGIYDNVFCITHVISIDTCGFIKP